MNPNYGRVAPFYDFLARILFGKALIKAQVYLLKYIPPGSRVVIVGGGTGWILDEISKIHPSGLYIAYVEIAEKMIDRAIRRNLGANVVDFICDDAKNVITPDLFDVVITPFLFDNFSEVNATALFKHIHGLLNPGGFWLNCDFQLTGKWWQKMMLRLMLIFFRLLCNVEANKLPDMAKPFRSNGYTAVAQQTFFGDFVAAKVYQSQERSI